MLEFQSQRRRLLALAAASAGVLAAGCASTAVNGEVPLKAQEGLVVLRLAEAGHLQIDRVTVVAAAAAGTADAERHHLAFTRFGQVSSATFVGRLPAGRYRLLELRGMTRVRPLPMPVDKSGGEFEVQAGRLTQLGTLVYSPASDDAWIFDDEQYTVGWMPMVGVTTTTIRSGRKGVYDLLLDPTPVPVQELLAQRYPQLAGSVQGAPLGWTQAVATAQQATQIDAARTRAIAHSTFKRIKDGSWLAGGRLGTVLQVDKGRQQVFSTGGIQAVEVVTELRDGRWLAGGEEGWLGISADRGRTWRRLSGPGVDEIVFHVVQADDGTIFMASSRDTEVVTYRATPDNLAWQVVRRLPANRKESWFLGERLTVSPRAPRIDHAGLTKDRWVVYTYPDTVSSMDLRTGQWETFETPRPFFHGVQVLADGTVVGAWNAGWVRRTLDYGKTWQKVDAVVLGGVPRFLDRQRGVQFGYPFGQRPLKSLVTKDGGENYVQVGPTTLVDEYSPLWFEPDGTLCTVIAGRVKTSVDNGLTWN